jgi:hypothetical protein
LSRERGRRRGTQKNDGVGQGRTGRRAARPEGVPPRAATIPKSGTEFPREAVEIRGGRPGTADTWWPTPAHPHHPGRTAWPKRGPSAPARDSHASQVGTAPRRARPRQVWTRCARAAFRCAQRRASCAGQPVQGHAATSFELHFSTGDALRPRAPALHVVALAEHDPTSSSHPCSILLPAQHCGDAPCSVHLLGVPLRRERSIRLSRAYRAIYEVRGGTAKFVSIEEVNKHDY